MHQKKDMTRKKKPLPILEQICITDYAAEGKAIARVDDMVVFVPWAVPGDVVDLQVRRKKHSFMEAEIIRFIQYSPKRIKPFCQHFGVCGGCKWQMIPYEEQLQMKARQVYDQLNERYSQTSIVLSDLQDRDREIYRAIFSTAPPVDDDSLEYNYDSLGASEIAAHYTKTTNNVAAMLHNEDSTVNNLFAILEKQTDSLKYIPSVMPLENNNLQYLAYGYGKKLDPIYKTPQVHKGIDFAAPKGTVVVATAAGTVEYVGEKRDHGVMVIIDHKNGFKTTYSHLSDYVVRTGKKIKRGETIGFVGNSGKSLTAHLHYQINYNGKAINPIDFFFEDTDPETYHKLIMMANNGGLCLD